MKPDGSGVTYEAKLSCPVCGLDLRGPSAQTYAEHYNAEHRPPEYDSGAFERYHDPRGGR
jgi:hypothetical protein